MSGVSFDDRVFAVTEALQGAALGLCEWSDAMKALADATGSKAGELIGLGRTSFQVITEISAEEMQGFTAANGHDPAVSSRVRVGMRAPVLQLLDESHFDREGDFRRSPAYRDVVERLDIPFAQITILQRSPEVTLGLSMLRTARAGDMPADQKMLLQSAARHVAGAVRVSMAAEGRAMDLTAVGFEQAEQAVFILDRAGRLRAMSAPAERLITVGDLRLKDGRLSVRDVTVNALGAAIDRARAVRNIADSPAGTVLAQDACGIAYPLEVLPLPSRNGFDFEAGVLVVARPPRAVEHRAAAVAASLFGLTRAEAAVAGLLAAGITATEIAAKQGVAVGTVRTHIRRIFEKSACRNQMALVAAIVSRM
ncbi:DNA-binding CsgD family transcriptional regulator [Brevundimonas alba]|uniref:DNA-binding CsgD family transcriptional regulator n=1 Tax=Brevundimonas alba TaxID=74314 RepID=A0A7X5YIF9_9CAUL|nr:LuxR C-terminal-related transcriptional regulator [Brevundimonas alba]NJC39796.1 DNA-binding CsgD family transcriptional regulator [Brevundimonas alba]